MIEKPFRSIGNADIASLVTDSVSEVRIIEFKSELPGGKVEDRKEFLADVSSFANAAGGRLIYGVSETEGVAEDVPGLANCDPDAEIGRLENLIRDGIAPRIPGVQTKAIEGFPNGPVLLIEIPRSWASPHMVKFRGGSRFFTRNSNGKHQLDVGEIRAAFALSESIPERIRNFRTERLGKIIAEEAPLPLVPYGKVVMHVLPMESFTQPPTLDMRTISNRVAAFPPLANVGGWNHRLNLDGLLTFNVGPNERFLSYAQLFRTGAIETLGCGPQLPHAQDSKPLYATELEKLLLERLPQYVTFQKALGMLPPIFVLVSILGVKGFTLEDLFRRLEASQAWNRIDRDTLLLPDIMLEDFDESCESYKTALRPVFDAVWQSAGFPGSPNFNDEGHWTG